MPKGFGRAELEEERIIPWDETHGYYLIAFQAGAILLLVTSSCANVVINKSIKQS